MKLTDILPVERWEELEKDIRNRSGLSANVFNTEGIRITDFHFWPNRLCPAVKATSKGQAFICAVAHMNLAVQASKAKKPVMEECDAGLLKIVVPLFVEEEFIGAVGACGLLLDHGEVDGFLVNRITEISEADVEDLSAGIGAISTQEAQALGKYIQDRIAGIVSDFQQGRSS